ncbi:MAG: hypothetical protein KI786_11480 [Mameliella sp.]|nr:hypothetical protein [Phaeodactylibacter sp.]NRA50492.1 hypothetical protein [Phaeodactylibacter sp.]
MQRVGPGIAEWSLLFFIPLPAMTYLTHSLLGCVVTMLAMLLPGMVNVTAAREYLRRGSSAAIRFNIGAAVAVFIHTYIAIAFAGLLARDPLMITYLRQIAVLLFLALSAFFGWQASRAQAVQASKRKGQPVLKGFVVSFLNLLNIPGMFALATFLRTKGLIIFAAPFRFFYVSGTAIGAFAMLSLYTLAAHRIAKAGAAFYQKLNLSLSGLFLLLALIQVWQLWS